MRTAAFLCMAAVLAGCNAPRPVTAIDGPAPVPVPALDAAAIAAARARGVAFLVVDQAADGTWGRFESRRTGEIYLGTQASHHAFRQATSALALLALRGPAREGGEVRAAFEKGVACLIAEEPQRRVDGGTMYNVWAHCFRLQALAVLLGEAGLGGREAALRAAAAAEVESLALGQSADGGWGYYDFQERTVRPSGRHSASFLTAAVLVALADARERGVEFPDVLVQGGLDCLRRLRLGNGAFIYGTGSRRYPAAMFNRVKGSLGRAQACNLALWRHGEADAEALRGGLDRLFEHHHFIDIGRNRPYPHEAWYATAGYYYYFGHYYAGRVIAALGAPGRAVYGDALAAAIVPHQDPQGAWWDFPFYGYHRAYGTALALLALEAAGL